MFKRILVANRGEIACRVIRACHELGVKTVAIYSKADAESKHVHIADEAICIGAGSNTDSYLNLASVLMAAQIGKADAVHPGYGYFSENPRFPEALRTLGVDFIGPSVEAIEAMGDKARAKQAARLADCPVASGSEGVVTSDVEAAKIASEIGFPVLLKAVAGGGGRGIRRVDSQEELVRQWKTAQAEAQASFGLGDLLVEKFVEEPRHVEFQILGDHHGAIVHLGERDCSIQNFRHQKIIEESPCSALTPELRDEMGAAAVRVARAVNYTNAGTVEFLLDRQGRFYFLEMNTRIQVEHPVTEEVTNMDLVKWQIRIAAGEKLSFSQHDVQLVGHAIEARITAQDPHADFKPSAGVITRWEPPGFRGVRFDTHIHQGFNVTPYYDPMIAKLIVRGLDRAEAVAKLRAALRDFTVEGIQTNIPFLRRVAAHPDFAKGDVSTSFVKTVLSTPVA